MKGTLGWSYQKKKRWLTVSRRHLGFPRARGGAWLTLRQYQATGLQGSCTSWGQKLLFDGGVTRSWVEVADRSKAGGRTQASARAVAGNETSWLARPTYFKLVGSVGVLRKWPEIAFPTRNDVVRFQARVWRFWAMNGDGVARVLFAVLPSFICWWRCQKLAAGSCYQSCRCGKGRERERERERGRPEVERLKGFEGFLTLAQVELLKIILKKKTYFESSKWERWVRGEERAHRWFGSWSPRHPYRRNSGWVMSCFKNGLSVEQIYVCLFNWDILPPYIGDLNTQCHRCLPSVPKWVKEDTVPNRCVQIGVL